jgi:molybdopterin molybdotransferase
MSELDLKDLSVEAARDRMLALAGPLGSETVGLDAARGRILAEPVTAARDQPPFDASAMDGWATRGPGADLAILGESAAGKGYAHPLAPDQAVRIFTGAPVPAGAERVVIQEVAERSGDRIKVPAAFADERYIRPRGGDFRAGDALLAAGVRLDAWRIGLAAAAGRADLAVTRRPRVAILATGGELARAGEAPGPDQIFDSGGPAVAALIATWGGTARRLEATGDDVETIAEAARLAGGDLIVTIGGASVGDHDLVKPALARLGLELAVETIRVRPGKPTWFGRLADGRLVLGLPGNPASAMVCAELFLRPLLSALQGADPALRMSAAQLASALPANGAREHWMRAGLSIEAGRLLAAPMRDQDSSLVSVFAGSGALIRRRIDAPAAEAGAVVDILPLERL